MKRLCLTMLAMLLLQANIYSQTVLMPPVPSTNPVHPTKMNAGPEWPFNNHKKNPEGPEIKGEIITGADRTEAYVNYLKGKNVAMVINQSSFIGAFVPTLDSLVTL